MQSATFTSIVDVRVLEVLLAGYGLRLPRRPAPQSVPQTSPRWNGRNGLGGRSVPAGHVAEL